MDKLLAKSSGETISEHTIACLNSAKALIDSLPFSKEEINTLSKDVSLAISMHDVGKAAAGFQKVLRKEQENWQGKRHEIISAAFASAIDGISPAVVFAILTHHKSIPSDGISQVFGCLPGAQIPMQTGETPIWNEMAGEWKEKSDIFLDEWEKICKYSGQTSSLNSCDLKPVSLDPSWLNRTVGKRGQTRTIAFKDRRYASLVRGLTIASDHLGSAHNIPPSIPKLDSFSVLKQNARTFQKHCGKLEGSLILRAPTGSGKTEAALLWAQKNQRLNGRLLYVLPYTASINAMYRRLAEIFGRDNVGLMHYRATAALYGMLEGKKCDEDLASHMDKQQIANTLADLAREIWFPIKICTPQQILRYILRGKGWENMLVEFPNACFIFDEIHAYDPKIVGLTLGSAKLFSEWGARCIFLSATLPEFLHKLINETMGDLPFVEPDPIQDDDRKILDKKRHVLEIQAGSIKEHIDAIVQAIQDNPSILIVCNHIKTSQDIYSLLTGRLPNEDIKLLHSQYNQTDRNIIESELTPKSLPKVLVATQVVEVSLNVDFDRAFFEPAPIDALIQRMGRVNRFGERPPAKITIFTKQVNSHRLYCECSGASHQPKCRIILTLEELQKLKSPVSESALVKAADKVYGGGYAGEDKIRFEEGLNHPDIKDFEKRLRAGAHEDWVDKIIEKTDGTVEVLPNSLRDLYEKKQKEGLWIEANSLLVPIRFRKLLSFQDVLNKDNDPWIIYSPYSSKEGLKIEKHIDNIID